MIVHVSCGSRSPSASLPSAGARFFRGIRNASRFTACAGVLLTVPLLAQKPAVVVSQVRVLGLTGGGVLSGGQPAGTSIGVTSTGNIILGNSYGNQVQQINGTTGAVTTLGTFSSAGAIAVDSSDNLYISTYGTNAVTKVPLVSGSYPAITTPSGSTPSCTGSDTVECNLKGFTSTYIFGYASMAFDPSGNFYFTTAYNQYYAGANPSSGEVWKCSAACFANAVQGVTGNAVQVYQETQPTGGPILVIGSLAIDALGNIFFTDSTFASATALGNLASSSSTLEEVPVTASAGTGYAATATTLYSYTVATPSNYDNQLDAVAVGASNTVYFATQNDGTFAMLNNSGVVDTADIYAVSSQGAKVMTSDRNGKFYLVTYSSSANADVGTTMYVGSVTATTAAVGTPSSTTGVSAALNSGVTCSNAPTTTVASTTAEFNATAGTCASTGLINAPVIPLTVSFAPTVPGTRTATLTVTSGANTGTATVTGVATGGAVPAPTFTPVAGTYSTTQAVTISDATVGASIYYTIDNSTPTTSSTPYTTAISVTSSETIKAIAAYSGSTTSAVASSAYTITATTAQTITFNQPASPVQYGVVPITLSASSTSGLTVTFSVTSGPGILSGNKLTITGSGSVVVTASQAGNSTYAAATPVSRTIVVNGGSAQSIFFPALANYTNGSTVPLIAAATSSLSVTFTVTGPATVNANGTLTVTGAGTVTVTAAQAGNSNFAAATSVSRSFTAQ